MKHILKTWIAAILLTTTLGGAVFATATPQPAGAACAQHKILGIPVWYKGLVDGNCEIKNPSDMAGGLSAFIWKIALNVIEIALYLVGYISVGFVLYGGFLYLISAGSSDTVSRAKKTIMNAIIGLVLSIASVAIVNLISGAIK